MIRSGGAGRTLGGQSGRRRLRRRADRRRRGARRYAARAGQGDRPDARDFQRFAVGDVVDFGRFEVRLF